jgi:hypothetical protein
MTTKIQLRRDNSSDWTVIDPTLAEGEIGFETNTGKFKIGDGISLWSSLDYFLDSSDLGSTYLTQSSASSNYQSKDADLTAIGALTGTLGILKKTAADTWSLITDNSTNWDTAYTDRNKWDGGATGLTAATGRTSLGLGTMATATAADYLTLATASTTYLTQSSASTTYAALAGATFTGRIIPRTGSATASTAPIDFTAGTLLSIPEDGALEYTSDGLYITSNPGTTTTGTGRGLIRAPQIVYSLANSSAATTSTPVSVFAAANDVLSILEPAKLYRFSGKYYLTSTFTTASGETNQILFTFSNAPTAIKYSVKSFAVSGLSLSGYQSSVATAFAVTGAVTKTESYVIEFDGYFTTHATATSTLTPQFQMSTTGSSTVVTAGSYIEIEKLGTSTQTLIAGNWA